MNRRVAVSCGRPERAQRYVRAMEAFGLEPVVLAPPEQRALTQIGAVALLLTGGTDVDPDLYGQERASQSDQPDRKRDRMENRLLREALEKDLPVLGICRGLQFMTVFHGGTLLQHHPRQATHSVRTPDRSLPAHDVIVRPGTRLAAILGEGRCPVNSRHHQAADQVPYRLAIAARAADGYVEAVERRDKAFVVAVQWHPEDMLNDHRQKKLFQAFRDALSG
jgi:putative glutamine amidotransferase